MIKKSKSTDSDGKQPEDQVAQAKTGLAEAGSKSSHSVSSKDTAHGNKGKSVAKKTDGEELDLSLNTGAESAADPIVLAQAETGTATDAATAGSSSSAAGTAGGGAGSAASGAATGAEGAGAFALSDAALGTMILGGVVGVAAIASTGGAAAAAPAATPIVGFILSGTIALGKVNNTAGDLIVEAFKADGTKLTGTGVVNADGTYTVTVTENYTGPVLIRLHDTNTTNTNYNNEATGAAAPLVTDLRVVINVSGSGGVNIPAAITPLTELAVRELVGDTGVAAGGAVGTAGTVLGATVTTAQVVTANDNVKAAFGLTGDITATTPVTVDNAAGFATATAAQQAYGQALAAISGIEANTGMSTGQVLNTLSQGVVGNVMSQSVVDQLLAGAITVDTTATAANITTPGTFATGTAAALNSVIKTNISAIHISVDDSSVNSPGSTTDFITLTAAQTITATLDAGLGGNKLWGSVDGGTTWTDISGFVTTTSLSWTGVTLNTGDSAIKLAVTAGTVGTGAVPAFTGAVADLVVGTKISVQNYGLDTANPVFTSVAAANFAENGTGVVYSAAATDAHLLTYTLTGADAALFNLDPNSGAVKFIAAPNFEAPADAGGNNVYDVAVTATDGAGNFSTQAVAITVTNVNEAPTLTSGATASFAENGTGTVYTASATDPDAGATLTYALAGADAALFNINSSTGAVTFKAAPNFEAPTDAGANNVYDVTVTASDGTLTTAAQAVAITVTNVNEAPTLTSGVAVSFAENGTGTAYTVTATDPDAGAILTYALAGTDAALFNINANTGVVTFASAPNFEVPADAGGNNVYDITVTASDGTLTTAAQAVAITVTNVNEAPTLTGSATSTATLAVNQLFSSNVSGLFSDVDAGNVFSYSATGMPAGIILNSATGVISGTPAATGTAPIVITATDSGGLAVSHTVTVNVVAAPVIASIVSNVAQAQSGAALTFTATTSEAVTVTGTPTLTLDVGGTPMTATYTGGTGTTALTFTATTSAGDSSAVAVTAITLGGGATVIGNTTGQSLVTTATGQVVSAFVVDNSNPAFTSATAVNYAENGTAAAYASAATDATALTYSLTGTDAALFNINASTGAVSFVAAPNFEAPADAGANNVYNVTVTATDALAHATNQGVAITVTNVNEAPTLTSGTTSTSTIVAGQAFSNNASGLFSDVDAGNVFSYSATGLPAGAIIDSATGVISGTVAATGTASVVVTATDSGGLAVSHTVAVSIVSAPTLTSNIAGVTNFDVTSNIVLNSTENVSAATGNLFIHIVNDANSTTGTAGLGFHGETATNTQDILVSDTTQVTIINNTITIHPTFNLDLANNYHITVDAGAFVGTTSHVGSVGIISTTADSFTTVAPSNGLLGVASAAASQAMDAAGNLVAGFNWVDIQGVGAPSSATGTPMDLLGGNIAMVMKDYNTTTLAGGAQDGIGVMDAYVSATNFAAGDMLYIDNQNNANANNLAITSFFNDTPGAGTTQISFGSDPTLGGLGALVEITPVGSPTPSFATALALQTLLATSYIPIISA